MRTKLFLLAYAALLAINSPAQATLSLEWWHGSTAANAFAPTTAGTPSSLIGLRNYSFSGTGIAPISSLTFNAIGEQQIISLVLRDSTAGFGLTLDDFGLQSYAVSFGYVPGVLEGLRDPSSNNDATTLTVSNLAGSAPGSATNAGNSQENYPFAISNFNANHFTIGNLFLPIFSGFDPGNGDQLYKLANIVVTAAGPGNGALTMSKPTTPPPTFGSVDPGPPVQLLSYDAEIWGILGTNVYSLPFTVVPEPSSIVLAGLAISGLGYRLRRKFRGEKAS